MKSLAHRLLTATVLTVWGTVLLTICLTGRVAAYLHPSFQPFALAAGCALVAFAFLVLVSPEAGTGHGAGSRSTLGGLVASLFLVSPLLLAFSTTRDSFTPRSIANRTYIEDAANLSTARPTPPANTQADDKFALPKTREGVVRAEVVDFLYAAQLPELREQLESRRVEVIGQLMPAKTNNPGCDRYVLVRMLMSCCAADAQPVALPIEPEKPPGLPEMGWVKATGTAAFPLEGGQRKPLLRGATIQQTEAPEEPFLY